MKLKVENLYVNVNGKEILKGVDLEIDLGKVHALMGPNGSGKSTLANVLMGNPRYEVTKGRILLDNKDITELKADERAKKGLFLSFQYPSEISGVTMSNFLRTAYNSVKKNKLDVLGFHKLLKEKMKELKMDDNFSRRYINEGFSGGEKKKAEILQLLVLNPKIAILDETDSGLDIDALKLVAKGIKKAAGPKLGVLLITHYQRILKHIKPDYVHILVGGRIVQSGDYLLAESIEAKGYSTLRN